MFVNKIIPFNIISVSHHLFHTTPYKPAVAKFMKKIMSGSKRSKKRIYYEENAVPTSNSFTKDVLRRNNPENKKRLAVLNKLFMRHITDLMTTGEYAALFTGYGIEINRVKVTSDYHGINLYWIAKECKTNEIEKLLESKTNQLRHDLTQLHIIGIVPRLKFIKDKEYARIMDVESRLAHADFGEDYENSDSNICMRSYLEVNKSENQQIEDKTVQTLEDLFTDDNQRVPIMPQNVMGLNHSEIMDRIKRALKKSQASHRNDNVLQLNEKFEHPCNPNPVQFKDGKAQRAAFKQFLTERQILKNRKGRSENNHRPDWEYLVDELDVTKQNYLDDWDEGDYLDEDEDFIENDDSKV